VDDGSKELQVHVNLFCGSCGHTVIGEEIG
jgi:hypothetical protein